MKYNIATLTRVIGIADINSNSERCVEIPFVLDNMPEPPAKILDVSCNYSSFILEMYMLGFDVYGIDVNDYGVPYGKFTIADARNIPFGNKSFDVVTCISALEHYGLVETPYNSDTFLDSEAPFTALGEMARIIKDDGMIILTLPYGHTENKDWLKWVKFYNRDMIRQLSNVGGLFIAKQQIKACINNIWVDISEVDGEKILTTEKVNCNISIIFKKIKDIKIC